MSRHPKPIKERFFNLISVRGDCWIWNGAVKAGVPCFSILQGQTKSARKFSYQLAYGKLPAGKLTHKCENTRCIKPEHTVLVSKLLPENVRLIRERWASHVAHRTTMRKLGQEFGLSKQVVQAIIQNRVMINV